MGSQLMRPSKKFSLVAIADETDEFDLLANQSPLGYAGDSLGNLYRYASNNPLSETDPSGLKPGIPRLGNPNSLGSLTYAYADNGVNTAAGYHMSGDKVSAESPTFVETFSADNSWWSTVDSMLADWSSYRVPIAPGNFNDRVLAGPAVGVLTTALSPRASVSAPVTPAWSSDAVADWFASLPSRPAVGDTPAMIFQRAVAGPTEYHVQGLGNQSIWLDGIEGTTAIEAKMVVNPQSSLQLRTAPAFIQAMYDSQMASEFARLNGVLLDPTNPLTSVEVRVSTQQAAAYWERVLADQGVVGRVVVPDSSTPAAPKVVAPGFVRSNAGALGLSAGLSAINGVAAAVNNIAWDVATKDVTNERTDPWLAEKQVQYLRDRIKEPRGVAYALWHVVIGSWRDEAEKQDRANQWLDRAQKYWKARQDAEIRDRLPVEGAARPVPYLPSR